MDLLEVIEEQRSLISSYNLMNEITAADVDVILDRIIEVAKQPLVMKRWTEDCKPANSGWYWYYLDDMTTVMFWDNDRGDWYACVPDDFMVWRQYPQYWLELEPTPILP